MVKDAIKSLASRAGVLRPLRTIYHGLRAFETQKTSKQLPPELVRDCRFCASRLHMLDEMPRGGVVAELGTYKGDFAREILQRCQPRVLHLIDRDYSLFDDAALDGPAVKRHTGLTNEVIATFPDDYFDWIYVDADHSYEGALRDAKASAPKIRPGGFLAFNDFAHIDPGLGRYGVHRAVVDFAVEMRWPFHFFAFEVDGLYDVVLRKI